MRSFPPHTSTSARLVTALICIYVGNIDRTSSKAPTTHSDQVWSSDKEGGGIVLGHGTSRRVRVSEVVLVVSIGGE
eukprot:scaffold197171_cov35-Attheya_sp.AAC.2